MNATAYILTFHGLDRPERELPDGEYRYWVARHFFEAVLDLVRNYSNVSITFDDANSSDYTIALPALLMRNMKASFFIVTDRIGGQGFLTADQVRELRSAGMGIGSHGTRHRPWGGLATEELNEELNTSRGRLENLLEQPVLEAACPFGSYNRRVLRWARSAGYVKVFTSDQGPATDGWLVARNTITRSHNLEYIENLIHSKPPGMKSLARLLKLAIKRVR